MSDFLMRLIERSRGARPTTQPRIPPIFAPESIPAMDSDAAASAPRLEPGEPPRSVEFGASSLQKALRRDDDVSVSVAASGDMPREAQASAQLARRELVPETKTANQPTTASLPAENKQQFVESETVLPTRARSVMAATQVAEKPAPDVAVSSEVTPRSKLTLHSSVSPTLPEVNPRLPVSPHPTEMNTPEQRAAPAAPTIRVTIGRVDVRAVMPAQPAPRPARRPSPSPSLSLEDYLKQRNGGRP